MINTFCMTHQVPLCQTCVRDHLHMQNPGNYHDATGQRAGQPVECDLLPIEQAINESLHRMQSSLQGVQEFIEFKRNNYPSNKVFTKQLILAFILGVFLLLLNILAISVLIS